MIKIKETLTTIYKQQKGLLALMLILLLAGFVMAVMSFFLISFNKPTVNLGYSDISGYRAGGWTELLAFPILALVWGVLHNFIALRLFRERGAGWAIALVILTLVLIVGGLMVLGRLAGEG